MEYIEDYEPTVSDFEGNWAGYDEDGSFVQGYSFSFDPEEDYSWGESGSAVEYFADGTITNYDKHTYEFGAIMLGEGRDYNWLWVETYSHDGFYEFTAAKQESPLLTFKKVDSIAVENGKVVIK